MVGIKGNIPLYRLLKLRGLLSDKKMQAVQRGLLCLVLLPDKCIDGMHNTEIKRMAFANARKIQEFCINL